MRTVFILLFTTILSLQASNDPYGVFARSLFLSYDSFPTKVYENQVFPVTVKAMVAREDFENLESEFYHTSSAQVLNPEAIWWKDDESTYYVTYYLKALKNPITLPQMRLSLLQDGITIESEILKQKEVEVIGLNHDKESCKVIAKDFEIIRFKTSRFDENSLIMVLEIEASEANLTDFHLNDAIKQGIESSTKNYPREKIFYFTVFDDKEVELSFKYFNLLSNYFEKISLPIILEEDDLSTQIGLNPKESSFLFYKDVTIAVFIILLLLLFIVRKKGFYLFLAILLASFFIYSKYPFSKLKIAPETNLRIVPTEKSTIFHTTKEPLLVEELGRRDEYIKILLHTGEIGWIKDSSVIKD